MICTILLLCYCFSDKSYLRYICFAKSTRAFLRNPDFDFNLNACSVSEFFISFDKMSHIFGAKKKTDAVPYLTEFALRLVMDVIKHKLSKNIPKHS